MISNKAHLDQKLIIFKKETCFSHASQYMIVLEMSTVSYISSRLLNIWEEWVLKISSG